MRREGHLVRAAEGASCSAGRFQGAHERVGRLGGPVGLEGSLTLHQSGPSSWTAGPAAGRGAR